MARYNPDDPYDLKIIEYEKIEKDKIKEYFTLRLNIFILAKKDFVYLPMENQPILCKWNNGLKKETIMMT